MKFPPKNETGAKNLVILKDNENITGVFRGELFEFRQHWIDKQPSVCAGRQECAHCKGGLKPSYRFRLNFVMRDPESGQRVAKLFEQGWTMREQLEALNEDYPLESTVVRIQRKGSGMNDTTYTILPVKGGALNPEQEKELEAVPLLPLEPVNEKPDEASPSFQDDDVPPF